MIIGIDGNEANEKKRVGSGEYAYELLMQFVQLKSHRPNLAFTLYLKNSPSWDLPQEQEGWTYRVIGPKKLWTQYALPLDLYLHKPRPDIFFTPTHYAPRFSPIPTVISIMDLSYIHFPDLFKKSDLYQLEHWTGYSIKNAKRVFTISNASKNDIINQYGIPEKQVSVTYPGIKKITEELPMKGIKKPQTYILFVGTLQPRKNITRLIQAFALILKDKKNEKKYQDLQLLIIGKKGWLYDDIFSAPVINGVEDKVEFLEYVSNEELAVLYKNALFFILPSLYEGFGLPVLEAMQHGCPVITSNVSSLPEAGGEAALYINPENVDDMVIKMNKLLGDENLRKELVKKGYKQVKKFNWEKTAEETLAVLEQIGQKT